jgi:hypothetical protein
MSAPSSDASQQLRELFLAFDADADGRISFSELCALLKSAGAYESDQQAKELMKRLDLNADGVISLDEFMGCYSLFSGDAADGDAAGGAGAGVSPALPSKSLAAAPLGSLSAPQHPRRLFLRSSSTSLLMGHHRSPSHAGSEAAAVSASSSAGAAAGAAATPASSGTAAARPAAASTSSASSPHTGTELKRELAATFSGTGVHTLGAPARRRPEELDAMTRDLRQVSCFVRLVASDWLGSLAARVPRRSGLRISCVLNRIHAPPFGSSRRTICAGGCKSSHTAAAAAATRPRPPPPRPRTTPVPRLSAPEQDSQAQQAEREEACTHAKRQRAARARVWAAH